MLKRLALFTVVGVAFAVVVHASADKPDATPKQLAVPEMKFNDVKEIAPGVFFRYSSISATDPKIPFGGSNNIWIVFKDYVVVIDANFPKEAADVIADIKKTTKKPIKYVLDTHHHGDHAYGNCVWAKEGAKIIAQQERRAAAQDQRPQAVGRCGEGPQGPQGQRTQAGGHQLRRQVRIKDDGTQRVEFMHFGHCHTAGDAVRLSAQAQDPLHRRRLRQRRLQLHGPFQLRDLDQVPRRDGEARHRPDLPRPRQAGTQGPARESRSVTSRELRACGEEGDRRTRRRVEEITKGSTCRGTRNGPAWTWSRPR